MAIPLPDLDTRDFQDLADEARATIPRLAPGWTDHNTSDPGITLLELLAAEADRLIYAADRITERDRLALLRLLGFAPAPPAPARGVLAFHLEPGALQRDVPTGTACAVRDPGGPPAAFATTEAVRVTRTRLAAVGVLDGGVLLDRTRTLGEGTPFPVFGEALVLTLDPPVASGGELLLHVAVGVPAKPNLPAAHHGAQTAWEAWDGTDWRVVPAVDDRTRALTQDGVVRLSMGGPTRRIRCSLVAGRHDATPRVHGIAVHAVVAEQVTPFAHQALGTGVREPAQVIELPAAPVVAASVSVTAGGTQVALVPTLAASGPHDLHAVLDPSAGTLTFGDGRRGRMLTAGEVVEGAFTATLAGAGNRRAGAGVDVSVGGVLATLPRGAGGGADAEATVHAAGRASRRLYAHERLLELVDEDAPLTLDGLEHARVLEREAPERALNALDLERIVLATPGCRIARARAWPGLDARWPGLCADGTASVIVLPELPAGRPEPTPGLLTAVRRHVEAHRLVGSRIVVTGPTYVEIAVHARLAPAAGAAAADVVAAATAALAAFLDPLRWPFGRDVHRAEVLAILDSAAGVDHVVDLELAGDGEPPTCGNVCVRPTAIARAGTHTLEVAA